MKRVRELFQKLNTGENWSLLVLQINSSRKMGISYVAREIFLESDERLNSYISDIANKYIGDKGCFDESFTELVDYDGTTGGKTIYHLRADNDLIADEYQKLITAIGNSNQENDPLKMKLKSSVLCGLLDDIPIKLFTMQTPVSTFKNKFQFNKGNLKEIKDKVLTLRTNIDVMIYGEDVYFLTLAGEKLFNMERAYKALSVEYIAQIKESGIIVDVEIFSGIAGSGHNPRRFVAYNQERLESMKDKTVRRQIAEQFSLPIKDDKIDTSQSGVSEKLVKILCNKGMIDPFENEAVEVSGSKKWI